MPKIITIVEGFATQEQKETIIRAFENLREFPAGLIRSYLAENKDRHVLQIITIWENMSALEEMRASGTPAAISVFQEAGIAPSLSILETVIEKPLGS